MNEERSQIGREVEEALSEVLAHVQGETALPTYEVPEVDVQAIRKELNLSRPKFAERFGLDARAVQDWEQGRRRPDKAARVLLRVIERLPEVVEEAVRSGI